MKRIAALIVAAVLAVFCCTVYVGCGGAGGSKTRVRLCEVTHSFFYAPMYIAINNGYFEDENIQIELSNGEGANNVMTALITNSADIGLMGPEATVYVHIEGKKDYPVIFGQLTKRDGSFLVGRTDEGDSFDWANLTGKKVLAGRKGGMPAMTLEYVMNQANVDTKTDLFDTSVAFASMISTFKSDSSYDYCTMFEPACSEFLAQNSGYYIVSSVGQSSGEVPYTCFSATKSYLTKNRDTAKAFLRAVVKGYNYMLENDAALVAAALAPSFEGVSLTAIEEAVKRYIEIDAWNSTPVMTEASFTRLQDIMENAGELGKRVSFTAAVDNSIASEVAG